MRQPEPRWRNDRETWVCRIKGQLHTLAKGKKSKQEAWKVLRGILASAENQSKGRNETILFSNLADLFLEWCQREKEPSTYEWYKYLLSAFCSFRKGKRARDLIPQDLNDWFAEGKQKFTAGTRSRAIRGRRPRPQLGREEQDHPRESAERHGAAHEAAAGSVRHARAAQADH